MARAVELFCEISGDTTNEYYRDIHSLHAVLAPVYTRSREGNLPNRIWGAALFFMSPQIRENVANEWRSANEPQHEFVHRNKPNGQRSFKINKQHDARLIRIVPCFVFESIVKDDRLAFFPMIGCSVNLDGARFLIFAGQREPNDISKLLYRGRDAG